MSNPLCSAARAAYGPAALDDSTPAGRARARLVEKARAELDRVWGALAPEEKVWFTNSQDAHSVPGALVREVVDRRCPHWAEVFRAVTRYAAAASVADGRKQPPAGGFTYLPTGPAAASRLRRRMREQPPP